MRWRIAQMGLLILGLCSLALVVGCGGGGGGGGPSDTAASLTDEGWDLFEQGNYQSAIGKFDGAIALDVSYAEAYEGLGWAYGKLDSLPRALANLELCIAKGMTTAAGALIVSRNSRGISREEAARLHHHPDHCLSSGREEGPAPHEEGW